MDQDKTALTNSPLAVLGPAARGKSTAVEIAVRQTLAKGGRVLVACPTGMLASRWRAKFPAHVDIDTVHGAFGLNRPENTSLDAIESFDLVVVEECGQLSSAIFERIMRAHAASGYRAALTFVGDFCQLRGIDPTRALDSHLWTHVQKLKLRQMRRCKCDTLKKKLEMLRTAKPSKQQLGFVLRKHRANRDDLGARQISQTDVTRILQTTPHTNFVTITKKGTAHLNDLAVNGLFEDQQSLQILPGDPDANPANLRGSRQLAWEPQPVPVHIGMKVILTRNLNKEMDFVNGMQATIDGIRGGALRVRTDSGRMLMVYPYTEEVQGAAGQRNRHTFYPLRVGYSTTLHKVQGATLEHMTVWLDVPNVEAAGYVALSRVQHDADWQFIGHVTRHHFTPASGF
jgi:ATP-dependent exoDNAse (exonuclease V) alpha subunit